VYTLTKLADDTNYVKVEFPTGGAVAYSPQIGQVQISDIPWYSAPIIDEMNDWTNLARADRRTSRNTSG